MNDHAQPSFELKTASLEEFLSLLHNRERDAGITPPIYSPLPRRAVCVQMFYHQQESGNHGLPLRTRYVLATFAYGADIVSFESVTSRSLEMSPPAKDIEKAHSKQMAEFRRIREAIESKIGELGIGDHVPVLEGRLQADGDTTPSS